MTPIPPAAAPSAAAPAAPAPAIAAPAEPTPEQREAARASYTQGQALFAQGNYAQAKNAFEQAYTAVPNPVVLLSTAECDVRLNQLDDAYQVLEQYLATRPDAPDRAEIEQKAAELLATPAQLVLTTEPAGAAIALDGQATGKVTPAAIDVKRGDHTIVLSLSGYESVTETIAARIGARHELQVVLHAAVVAAPPPAPEVVKVNPGSGKPTTALWITGILGATGLVTGTVLGFMVLAERSDYDAHPTKATADRGERLALFTDVAFGVGTMALITSAVLYLTADEASDSGTAPALRGGASTPPAPQAARLHLLPVATAHGAALTASGRF